jgi:hypothetical protein
MNHKFYVQYSGFRFTLNYKKGGKKNWRCEKAKSLKCKVTAQTSAEDITRGIVQPNSNPESHIHLPDPAAYEVPFFFT